MRKNAQTAKAKRIENTLTKVFAEWDRRYRKNPEQYMNNVQHLLGNTPYTYGRACAVYFTELMNEMEVK
jgi:hypothetical protein